MTLKLTEKDIFSVIVENSIDNRGDLIRFFTAKYNIQEVEKSVLVNSFMGSRRAKKKFADKRIKFDKEKYLESADNETVLLELSALEDAAVGTTAEEASGLTFICITEKI